MSVSIKKIILVATVYLLFLFVSEAVTAILLRCGRGGAGAIAIRSLGAIGIVWLFLEVWQSSGMEVFSGCGLALGCYLLIAMIRYRLRDSARGFDKK